MDTKTFIGFVQQRFTEKKWRVTAGVRNVSEVLVQQRQFYSVQDIERELMRRNRGIDTVTIYRILSKLSEVGLVHEFEGKWHHETDPSNPLQGHFLVCDETGWAEEIHLDYFDAISKQLAREKGFLLKDVRMAFFGKSDPKRRPKD